MNKFLRLSLIAAVLVPVAAFADPDFGSMRNTHKVMEAPKAIPHPIERYVPITNETNYCAMCHIPATSLKRQPIETPLTHFNKNGLDERRYVCTMCHMPMVSPEK